MVQRVIATDSAIALIERLKAQHGPSLLFYQSGGCCDGSAPNCYLQSEFQPSSADVLLGEIGACPYYVSRSNYEFIQHTQTIIDTTVGRGGDFSLEAPEGICFIAHSRVYSDEEWQALPPLAL